MHRLLLTLSIRRNLIWTVIAFLSIPGVGALDYLTGQEVTLSPLYFIPVAVISWYSSASLALAGAILGALAWQLADFPPGRDQHGVFIFAWNFAIRLLELSVASFVLSSLQRSLAREREHSRVDGLTGATNARAFSEIAKAELGRSKRYQHPLTLAYIDVDHFKAVNDTRGHLAGDALLKTIVGAIRATLRADDTLARLGGDEFVVLLPETDVKVAETVIERVLTRLSELAPVRSEGITFSIGVVTCTDAPEGFEELIGLADQLMYDVKRSGRNGIAYTVYPESRV